MNRDPRKPSPKPVMRCNICRTEQVIIGKGKDWLAIPGGHVCGRDVCRDAAGVPRLPKKE